MTHFLWVEDFKASETNREDNIISSTVNLVFSSVLKIKNKEFEDEYEARDFLEENGVFLKLNLLEALEFIRNPTELAKIDFVVLDVDMPLKRDGQIDSHNYLPPLIEQYQSETELKKIAGYQIYIDLVIELGFPKNHILFCSNHAGYFEQFVGKFKSSNIKFPELLQKEHDKEIKDWLTAAQSDYFVLRRGIIEGCRAISKNLTEKCLSFNSFIEPEKEVNIEDMRDYLSVLENFLPLREPSTADKAILCKLFIRTLTHEWEATEPKKIRGLAWIMKGTRNWITHNSSLFSALDETMVAYLFIINMRLMFSFDEAVQAYEKILFKLFSEDALTKEIFETQNKNGLSTPIKKAYCNLQNLVSDKSVKDAFRFPALANNIQESNSPLRNDKSLFAKLLYQMFWLINSPPVVDTRNGKVEINFKDFDYRKNQDHLFELARHIYNLSFS